MRGGLGVTRRSWLLLLGLPVFLFLVGCQSAPAGAAAGQATTVPNNAADALGVDAGNSRLLLPASGGVFQSADQGQTWQVLSIPTDLHPDRIDQVAISSADPARSYAAGSGAGVLRSDDGGQSWRRISEGLLSQDVAALAVHSFRPETLYAWLPDLGIFRTEDGGGRWQKMDDGPPAPIVALAHSTLDGSMNTGWLYAATPEGLYVSMDCF